jgi:hypothetical protein
MKIPMIISSRSPEGVGHTLEQTAEIFANSGLSAKYGRVITWFARYYSNVENIPNHLPFEYVEKMSAAAKSSSPFAIAKQDLGTIDTRHSALRRNYFRNNKLSCLSKVLRAYEWCRI